jgi:hypothetical protein
MLRPVPLPSIGDFKWVVHLLLINFCTSELALKFAGFLRRPLEIFWWFLVSMRRRLPGFGRELRFGTGLGIGVMISIIARQFGLNRQLRLGTGPAVHCTASQLGIEQLRLGQVLTCGSGYQL